MRLDAGAERRAHGRYERRHSDGAEELHQFDIAEHAAWLPEEEAERRADQGAPNQTNEETLTRLRNCLCAHLARLALLRLLLRHQMYVALGVAIALKALPRLSPVVVTFSSSRCVIAVLLIAFGMKVLQGI